MHNPGCRLCPLHLTTSTVCVWGEGAASGVMLVGEAPGAAEENLGRPFVGDAGRALNEMLNAVGLARADVYISNVTKCRPPANRKPQADEVHACRVYLNEEVEAVQPKVIVALGVTAMQALTGRPQVSGERGRPIMVEGLPAPVVPTFHPAATLYRDSAHARDAILADLRLAKAIASGPVSDHDQLIVLPAEYPREHERPAAALLECDVVAVDLEWTAGTGKTAAGTERKKGDMIWPWSNRGGEIYSISLTGLVEGRYTSRCFGWPLRPQDYADVQDVLAKAKLVFHNAVADLPWLARGGFKGLNLAADTMVLAHMLDEMQALNLEAVAVRYGGVPAGWKGVLYHERPRTREDWERLLTYNATDTYATLKAFFGEARAISQLGERAKRVRALHSRLMIPGVRALVSASVTGVPLNAEKMREALVDVEARRDAAAVRLARYANVTPPMAAKLAASPKQTLDFLRSVSGLPINTSRAGELVDHNDDPAVRDILAWRQEQKLVTAYLRPWLALMDQQGENRLHTVYRPTGTRTGRFSAEGERGGTLQTMPREEWVRNLVEAPPGRLIVAADYSQIELRVLAWIAQEPTMIAAFRNGEDLHRITAAFLIVTGERGGPPLLRDFWAERHLWVEKVTKEQRFNAKAVNFGLAYGMMPPKFRTHARQEYGVEISMEEARAMHRAYFQLYGRLAPWHGEIMSFARTKGAVETPFGRWLTIDPRVLHVAMNTPIQSVASDLTVLAMGYAFESFVREGVRARVIGFVHDSILVDAHEDDAERAGAILKEVMENLDTGPFDFTIPLPLVADVSIGQRWS